MRCRKVAGRGTLRMTDVELSDFFRAILQMGRRLPAIIRRPVILPADVVLQPASVYP
jgi:hypothetical protein